MPHFGVVLFPMRVTDFAKSLYFAFFPLMEWDDLLSRSDYAAVKLIRGLSFPLCLVSKQTLVYLDFMFYSESTNTLIFILNRIETVNFCGFFSWLHNNTYFSGLGILLSSVLLVCIIFKTNRDVGNFKYLTVDDTKTKFREKSFFTDYFRPHRRLLFDCSIHTWWSKYACSFRKSPKSFECWNTRNFWILFHYDKLYFTTNCNHFFPQKVITHEYKFCLITLNADNLVSQHN